MSKQQEGMFTDELSKILADNEALRKECARLRLDRSILMQKLADMHRQRDEIKREKK